MNLTNYILPYPYEAFNKFERRFHSFEEYRDLVYGWASKNTDSFMTRHLLERLDDIFDLIEKTQIKEEIKTWIIAHIDKIRYISDFSGLAFGIQVDERCESINLCFPTFIKECDAELYPMYDENTFKNLSIIDKLNWIYEHCEFIPFRILYENICVNSIESHKFSHIKKDSTIMAMLQEYFHNAEFQPNDNVYYFVCYDWHHAKYYLRRDQKDFRK